MADGPRALQPHEWDQLHELLASAFRSPSGRRPDLDGSWLLHEQNRTNLRVIAEDGKVVSHAGMIHHHVSLFGCTVKVTCVGEVGTYEAYRGRGFGSQVFQDCCDKAAADGVDFMQISGGRSLYTRVGCRRPRGELDFTITSENVAAVRAAAERFDLAAIDVEHATELSRISRIESVRFFRPLDEWRLALRRGKVLWRDADFWGIRRGSELLAYLFVNPPAALRRAPDSPPRLRVAEYAGDRAAIFATLPFLLDHYDTPVVSLYVQPDDSPFLQRLSSVGIAGEANRGGHTTIRVINFVQLMERCRPLLAERLGDDFARELRFASDERPGSPHGGFTISRQSDSVRLPSVGALANYLFGVSEGDPVVPDGSPALAAALAPAFPFPTLWYGVSYV